MQACFDVSGTDSKVTELIEPKIRLPPSGADNYSYTRGLLQCTLHQQETTNQHVRLWSLGRDIHLNKTHVIGVYFRINSCDVQLIWVYLVTVVYA